MFIMLTMHGLTPDVIDLKIPFPNDALVVLQYMGCTLGALKMLRLAIKLTVSEKFEKRRFLKTVGVDTFVVSRDMIWTV